MWPMAQEPDLSPPDAGFEVVRRGYDQGQVDNHLRRLDAEIQILATDRDAALDQSAQLARELDDARARAERLRVQVRSLVSPPQSVQGMSERMRSMLRLAEDEAGEMLSQAERGRPAPAGRRGPGGAGPRGRPGGGGRAARARAGRGRALAQEISRGPGRARSAELTAAPRAARGRPGGRRRTRSPPSASRPSGSGQPPGPLGVAPKGDRGGLHDRHEPPPRGGIGRCSPPSGSASNARSRRPGERPRRRRAPTGAGRAGGPAGAGAGAGLGAGDHRRGPAQRARAVRIRRQPRRATRR